MEIELGVRPRELTLFPRGTFRGLATSMVCEGMGARYDGELRRYVMPIEDAPKLLVPEGLHIIPSKRVAPALRATALHVRQRQRFLDGVEGELYPYQQSGVSYLWRNPAALLFDEMGLGKTVEALCALDENVPVLVICPAFLKLNWAKEAKKWRPGFTTVVLEEFRYPEPGEICIINYARLPTTAAELKPAGNPWPSTAMVCDEAHKLKNGRALRTKGARLIARRVHKVAGLVWLLTGTPLLNDPKELWGLLTLLGRHKSTYGSYTNFAKMHGGRKDAFGFVFDADKVTPEANNLLKAVALRRERADVLPDLPTKTYQMYSVPKPDDKVLVESLDNVDLALLEMALDGEEMQLQEVAFLSTSRQVLAKYKASKLTPLLCSHEEQDSPLVVFSAHKDPVIELGKRKGWECIHGAVTMHKRQRIVDSFQRGELKGLAATVQTMVGWTLTRAHHAVFLDRTYVPGENVQAEDRVCRIGQDRGVVVTDVVCGHPLDAMLHATLMRKQKLVAATTGKLASKEDLTPRASLADELDAIAEMIEGAGK